MFFSKTSHVASLCSRLGMVLVVAQKAEACLRHPFDPIRARSRKFEVRVNIFEPEVLMLHIGG
jgi:hypothetical protein